MRSGHLSVGGLGGVLWGVGRRGPDLRRSWAALGGLARPWDVLGPWEVLGGLRKPFESWSDRCEGWDSWGGTWEVEGLRGLGRSSG